VKSAQRGREPSLRKLSTASVVINDDDRSISFPVAPAFMRVAMREPVLRSDWPIDDRGGPTVGTKD
jgi:hypothetical protein